MMQGISLLAALLGLTSAAAVTRQTSVACNNSPDLCSKAYSDIAQLAAHDSPFLRDASTGDSDSGDQYYNSTVQLGAGVRMLTAQVHNSAGAWHLCHTSCDLLDAGLLSDWLVDIKTWMDNNPNEVVTLLLVNSDNATPADLASQFSNASIDTFGYRPPAVTTAQSDWPTLQTLIDANTRLVTFVASLDTSQIDATNSYLIDEFTFAFETNFQVSDSSGFNCTVQRPSSVADSTTAGIASGRLSIVNHFLYEDEAFGIQIPNASYVATTNSPSTGTGTLGQAAADCKSAYGKVPNFFLVDFFNVGPAIQAIDNLNGVTSPVGRTTVSTTNTPPSTSGAGRASTAFAGVVALVKLVQGGAKPSQGAWIWAAGDYGSTFGGINLSGGSLVQ